MIHQKGPQNLDEKYMVVQHRPIVCLKCVCVSLLPLLWSWSVHQSPERVSARHLVRCLLHTSFGCVYARPSLCLPTLPLHHCVCVCFFLSLSITSVLLGWSPRLWMSYFWRFLLWKYSPLFCVTSSLPFIHTAVKHIISNCISERQMTQLSLAVVCIQDGVPPQ